MKTNKLPFNLQFFADAGAEQQAENQQPSGPEVQQQSQQAATPEIDYAKIQQMLDGTLAAKEDTALKSYFRQQGLTQEEAEKAMSAFKAEKAKNTPDAAMLQSQIAQEKANAQKAQVENATILAAVSLGLDTKTIPYVLKMADLSNVTDKDGKINEESVKTAINKVLEDVPQLKPAAEGNRGFQIGGGAQNPQQQNNTQSQVPTKRWNRFNN